LETEWLFYARRLLADKGHIAKCDLALGPEAVWLSDADDLRWPGYLGSEYRPGGLLLVATVHREFASGRPPLPAELTQRLVDCTRAWRDGALDDDTWLGVLRDVYALGLAHHWAVGRLIRALENRAPFDVHDVAYVNAARCQLVENPPLAHRAEIIKRVVALCAIAYPVAALLELLQPGAVIISKGAFDATNGALDRTVPLFVVDQRQLVLRAECRLKTITLRAGTRISEWAPQLAELLS
jgi:hypothetical protein